MLSSDPHIKLNEFPNNHQKLNFLKKAVKFTLLEDRIVFWDHRAGGVSRLGFIENLSQMFCIGRSVWKGALNYQDNYLAREFKIRANTRRMTL